MATGLVTIPAHATLLGLTTLSPGGSVVPGNATNSTATITGYKTACPTFTPTPHVAAPPTTLTIAAGSTVVADTCDESVIVSSASKPLGTATLREVVARESGGTLDFYYQSSFAPNAGVTGWGISDIFGVPYTANPSFLVGNYLTAALLGSSGTGPSTKAVDNANKSAGGGFGGTGSCTNGSGIATGKDCITFDFGPSLTTAVVVISTTDTLFSALTRGDMGLDADNGLGTTAAVDAFWGYVPLGSPSSVPEPVSIVLLGTILAFSAFFIRRRKSAKNESSVS